MKEYMPSLSAKPPKKSASTRRPLNKKNKLLTRFFAPIAAMVITIAGVGVATQLSQRSQDNRSDASTGNGQIQTLELTAVADKTITSGRPDDLPQRTIDVNGQKKPVIESIYPVLYVDYYDSQVSNSVDGSSYVQKHGRSLLKFSLSELPANATVESVELQLKMSHKWQDKLEKIRVARIATNWNEDVTWNQFYTSTGIAVDPDNQVVTEIMPSIKDIFTFDVTNQLKKDTQSGEVAFLLSNERENETRAVYFWSKDCDNPLYEGIYSHCVKPKLVIRYRQPETLTPPPCREEKVSELYVRTSSEGGAKWGQWAGPNTAVTVGTGSLTGFSAWTDATAITKQYAVKGGQLWTRTYGRDKKWSSWSELSNPTGTKGTGSLTSFSTHFFNGYPLNGVIRQYAVKGGQLWVRSSTSTPGVQPVTFADWAGPNKVADAIGTGTLTGFSSYESTKNRVYENKQYAVKGGQLWVRTSNNNANWTAWAGPNPAADTAGGPGTLMSFATIQEGTEFKQYAVKEKTTSTCIMPR